MTRPMPELVETLIEDGRWRASGLEELAETACRAVLSRLDLPAEAFEIGVLGCDDDRIAALNADFRDKPRATNVLSWPAVDLSPEQAGAAPSRPDPGPPGMPQTLGDIAISYDTCAREAAEQGKPLAAHVSHLLVHGCLHLLGFDHIRPADAARMEALEVELLERMGIADPYL